MIDINLYVPILTFIGQMIVASIAIIIAIWGDTMKTWFRHPTLEMEIEPYIKRNGNIATYYYIFLIKNRGKLCAEKVEVFAKKLLGEHQTNIESFIPRRFKWIVTGEPICDIISPDAEKYCEFLHFDNPENNTEKKLDLDLEDLKISGIEEIMIRPHTWYIVIQITSSNSQKPVEKILQINHTGDWSKGHREAVEFKIIDKLPNTTDTMVRPI